MKLVLNTNPNIGSRYFVVSNEEKKVCFGILAWKNCDCIGNFAKGASEELDADEIIINKVNYDEDSLEGSIEFTSVEDGESYERKYSIVAIHIY